MLSFLSQYLSTIIVAAVVFGLVSLSVGKQIRDYKNHKNGCGCGCQHCPSSDSCHPH